jgi:hypothetical protein
VEYSALVDVTCLSHGLNLVAGKLLDAFPDIMLLMSRLRFYFIGGNKAQKRRRWVRRFPPGFLNAIFVGDTRWRDRLDCVIYLRTNLTAIIAGLDEELEKEQESNAPPARELLLQVLRLVKDDGGLKIKYGLLMLAQLDKELLKAILESQKENLEASLDAYIRLR